MLVLSTKWYCDGIRAFIFMEEKIQDKTNSSTRRIAKNTVVAVFPPDSDNGGEPVHGAGGAEYPRGGGLRRIKD